MKLPLITSLFAITLVASTLQAEPEATTTARGNKDLQVDQVAEEAKPNRELQEEAELKVESEEKEFISEATKPKKIEDEIATYSILLDSQSPGISQEILGYSVLFPELPPPVEKEPIVQDDLDEDQLMDEASNSLP